MRSNFIVKEEFSPASSSRINKNEIIARKQAKEVERREKSCEASLIFVYRTSSWEYYIYTHKS